MCIKKHAFVANVMIQRTTARGGIKGPAEPTHPNAKTVRVAKVQRLGKTSCDSAPFFVFQAEFGKAEGVHPTAMAQFQVNRAFFIPVLGNTEVTKFSYRYVFPHVNSFISQFYVLEPFRDMQD